jgi:hypothetical protein
LAAIAGAFAAEAAGDDGAAESVPAAGFVRVFFGAAVAAGMEADAAGAATVGVSTTATAGPAVDGAATDATDEEGAADPVSTGGGASAFPSDDPPFLAM